MSLKLFCAFCAIALTTASQAAPAKAVAPSQSRIDARGVAALDKAVAYYQKPRSFGLSATQKVFLDGKVMRSSRLQMSLQAPYRASLRTTLLDDKGQPVTTGVVRLMDAKSLYLSQSGVWPTVRPIGAAREQREDGLKEIFQDVPGVMISVVAMALGYEPSRDSNIKSVRYGEVRENGKTLKSVTITRKTPADATGITAEFRLNPRSYAVEKVVFYLVIGGKNGKVVTEIGSPVSNWKGSQSATDAAVYNWKTLAPEIPLAPSAPKTKTSVDPKARAIFARAAKMYGAAKGLSVRWKSRNESGETSDAAFDFDRAGRLRLVNVDPFEPLIVMDGKTRWSLGSPDETDENGRATYRRIEADDVEMEMQLAPGLAGVLGNLLNEVGPLDTDLAPEDSENLKLQELRAIVLPPQPFNGEACDLVRVSHIYAPLTKNGPTSVGQQTFWFARASGALVRFQERSVMARKDTVVADAQVTSQRFDPKFAPNTFKFTPPKGAVLQEY